MDQHPGMTLTSEIRIKFFSGKQVGQHRGIKLKQATKYSDSLVHEPGVNIAGIVDQHGSEFTPPKPKQFLGQLNSPTYNRYKQTHHL